MKESSTTPIAIATGCPVEPYPARFARALSLFASVLREIFDESAYTRFLDRRQLKSSREAYAAFRQEYESAKARRPRCC